MTLFLVDIASYQHERSDPINLAAAKAQGVSLVNIKTTQGTGYTFTAGATYAAKARELGMGICAFHYLTGGSSGAAQAEHAWKQILRMGGPQNMAIECDCEADATEQIMRDFVNAMQDKIQRHVLIYSGDWWWQPRGWNGASLTPYYTGAPNAGYLGSYPGDNSSHWNAGYGGWSQLAMMQYAVSPMSGVGGGNLSKSAIRYPNIWTALTGGIQVTDPTVTRQWPAWMPVGHYFGLKNGPAESHGGYYGVDIPEVKAIQQRLQQLNFAPSTASWADGDYGEATATAVRAWQANQYPASQHAGSGQIWPDDWKVLFAVPVVTPPPVTPPVTPPTACECKCLTEAQVIAAVKKALKEGTD